LGVNERKHLIKKILSNSSQKDSILRLRYKEGRKNTELKDYFKKEKDIHCWKKGCREKWNEFGHILRKNTLKDRKKGVRHLNNFKNSIFNLVPLCSNCHNKLDSRKNARPFTKMEMDSLIKRKEKFNRKILNQINKDFNYYEKNIFWIKNEEKN